MLYVGEGPRGSNGACSTLYQILVTPFANHNQIGPLWCWFPSGWACVCSRPLWVSPMTCPVRLGVSPAAAWTPTPEPPRVFSIRGLRLYFLGWSPRLLCLLRSPALPPVYLCTIVGPLGYCLPRSSHTLLLLWIWPSCPKSCAPQLPVSAHPTSLDKFFFFISLVVGLPCGSIFCQFCLFFLFLNCCCPSFACARRLSVSTYASILAGSPL